jgi:porin
MKTGASQMQRTCIAFGIALALGCAIAAPASAAGDDSLLFGNWRGTRPDAPGIDFDFGYVSEAAHNFSGGSKHETAYTDQWSFGAKLDLDRLMQWRGATFQVAITHRSGKDLGAEAGIGNNQLIQEVYGRGQTWHLTVFALDQEFFGGALDWRIGRLPVGSDIHGFSCDFQNLTFCGAQPGNIVGDYWVNWPTSQWGTRLKLRTSAETYLQLGAYQLSADYVDDEYARHKGLSLDVPDTDGWLLPLEFGWTPTWKGMPGSYKAGIWYNTAGGDDLVLDVNHQPRALTGDEPRQRDSRYGGYVSFQQQVTGESANDGWVVFFNATQADTETSATDRQIALGGEYHGPFGRPYDFIGVAVGATHANGRQARFERQYNETHPDDRRVVHDGNEYVGEVFYSFSPVRSMQLRANLQYIHNPGGTDLDDAFVAGLKTVISF